MEHGTTGPGASAPAADVVDPVRVIGTVPLRARRLGADDALTADGDRLAVRAGRLLDGTVDAPLDGCRVGVAASTELAQLRSSAPLLLPELSHGPGDAVVLLFDDPVPLPPLRPVAELDLRLQVRRADTLGEGLLVDGLVLATDRAAGDVVAELQRLGVGVVADPLTVVGTRRRAAAAAGRRDPVAVPTSHAALVLALHVLTVVAALSLWPADRVVGPLWAVVVSLLLAALVTPPLLARRRAARRRAEAAARRDREQRLARFG